MADNIKQEFSYLDIPDGNGGTERWYCEDAEARAAIEILDPASVEAKANKVTGATSGNLAGLDSNGDLTDSGKPSSLLNPAVAPDAVQGTNGSDGIMTAADKGKLNGIESGAEVNVNADWNASSGDAQILNKPTLGTAAAKGVAQEVNTSENLVQSNHVKSYVDNATGAIEEKIPTQASSTNQLADKDFVNSSISTATADYKGSFNLVSDLELTTSATHSDIATALATAISTSDNNDYAFVQIPTSDSTPTEIASIDRYKKGSSAWEYEYTLNNSGYTSAQWAAINSTITSALVTKLNALPDNAGLTTLLSGKVNTSDVQTTVDTSATKIPTSSAVKTYVDGRSLVPVNMNALTTTSTFVEGNVIGLNGILYRAKRNTSNFPVVFATQDGDFVTHTINGNLAYVITDWTLNSDWEVFMDASIGYTLASKQDALAFDTTPTNNSNNMVKSGAIKAALDLKLNTSLKGANSGLAELDSNGKVPSSQLPSYVDDVLEYTSKSSFPATGETGKIYVAADTNLTWRWSGSAYVEISPSLALGETSATAYRGDRGKTAYDHSQVVTGNPHNVTKSDLGLGNVGNYKAVSTVASQGLTAQEQANSRANIGAGSASDVSALLAAVGSPAPSIHNGLLVDLGLPSGTLWAKCNVGASVETDYGNYYAYGKGLTQWTPGATAYSGTENPLSLSADTAYLTYGTAWHMPTKAQLEELMNNTTVTETTINSVFGFKCTATNGNYIFFPAAGHKSGSSSEAYFTGTSTDIWSNKPNGQSGAAFLSFTKDYGWRVYDDNSGRGLGYSVRGVVDGGILPSLATKTGYTDIITVGTSSYTVQQLLEAMVALMPKTIVVSS